MTVGFSEDVLALPHDVAEILDIARRADEFLDIP
jgi:hypothetical protein